MAFYPWNSDDFPIFIPQYVELKINNPIVAQPLHILNSLRPAAANQIIWQFDWLQSHAERLDVY